MTLSKFKDLANKQEKKTKSTAQVVVDPSVDVLCDQFLVASKNFKNAEAELKQKQAEVIDYISPIHFDRLNENNLEKTFKINDKVMCIFGDRFSALSNEDVQETQAITTEAKVPFEKLFKEKVTLKLKKGIEENEKELEKLIELLGEGVVEKYFEVGYSVHPTDDFYVSVTKEGLVNKLRGLIERIRYKPTVKVS